MPIIAQALAIAAMASFGLSFWAAYLAWPKFKNLERRAELRKPVPDLMGNGNTNSFRASSLIWATRLPDDRPKLRRSVLACRGFQLGGLGLMLAAMVVMGSANSPQSFGDFARNSPPPFKLIISDQDQ